MVSAAAGGVHLDVVVTLAFAVSFTERTDVASDATEILASRLAGCLAVTELILQEAVPSPLAQPLLNSGFSLDGVTASATVTSDTDPFFAETCTTKEAVWPRLMLDLERSTLTHSSARDMVLVLLGLGLEEVLASSVSVVAVAWLVVAAEVEGEAELEGEADLAVSLTLPEGDADRVSLAVA
jgi:hypothetical protein